MSKPLHTGKSGKKLPVNKAVMPPKKKAAPRKIKVKLKAKTVDLTISGKTKKTVPKRAFKAITFKADLATLRGGLDSLSASLDKAEGLLKKTKVEKVRPSSVAIRAEINHLEAMKHHIPQFNAFREHHRDAI